MKILYKAKIHSGSRYTWNTICKIVYVIAEDFGEAEDILLNSEETPWEWDAYRKVVEISDTHCDVVGVNKV